MKRLVLSTFVLLAMSFTIMSCGNDDDPKPNTDTTDTTSAKLPLLLGDWSPDNVDSELCSSTDTLTFKETGIVTVQCEGFGAFDLKYELSQDANTFIMQHPFTGGMLTYTVVELSETSFVFTNNTDTFSYTKL